jgi:hypothetical protein
VKLDFLALYSRLAQRWGWRFAPVAILLWTVLLPVTVPWLLASLIVRYRTRDRSVDSKVERRVARLLSMYPADWRAQYGEEFADILRDTIRDGRGGMRLTANVIRESNASRIASARPSPITAIVCLALCWIPLIPQGVVPLIMKLSRQQGRSWFLALYLPDPYAWITIAWMLAVGSMLLAAALRIGRVRSVGA